MACIVYQTNKKSGYVYAYHAVSFRDPISKMPKSKRTFIGRVDPKTKDFLNPEKAMERLSKLEPVKQALAMPSGTTNSNENEQQILAELVALRKEVEELKSQLNVKNTVLMKIRNALDT